MSAPTAESILDLMNQLPAMERAKLIAQLTTEQKSEYVVPEGRIISTNAPYIDRTKEYEWLGQHRCEYPGQWLALMGDQLVASGTNSREVLAQARSLGFPRAILFYVEASDLPFVD